MRPLIVVCLAAVLTVAAGPVTDEQKPPIEERLNGAWQQLSPREKMQLMRLHRALNEMPPEERKFIHDRIERFLNMPAEDRQRLRENADRWKSMTPEQQEKAREEFRKRRAEFEEKWRREHPGEEPPPGPFRKPKPPVDGAPPAP